MKCRTCLMPALLALAAALVAGACDDDATPATVPAGGGTPTADIAGSDAANGADAAPTGDVMAGDAMAGDATADDATADDVEPAGPDSPPPTGDPCVDGQVLSAVIDIVLPEDPIGCPWGEDGSIPMDQAIATARDETVGQLFLADSDQPFDWLDDGGVLCDIRMDSMKIDPTTAIQDGFVYDDMLLVVYGDIIVMSTFYPILENFVQTGEDAGNFFIYDWDDLLGQPMTNSQGGFQGQAYCMGYDGENTQCLLPQQQTPGELLLSFAGDRFDLVRQHLVAKNDVEVRFVTLGDNDPGDCHHTGFRMRALVEVALPGTF